MGITSRLVNDAATLLAALDACPTVHPSTRIVLLDDTHRAAISYTDDQWTIGTITERSISDIVRQSRGVADAVHIIDIVAASAGFEVADLTGPSRVRELVGARHIAMWLIRRQTVLSYPAIGELFGDRDHTTIIYAVKGVDAARKKSRAYARELAEFLSYVEAED